MWATKSSMGSDCRSLGSSCQISMKRYIPCKILGFLVEQNSELLKIMGACVIQEPLFNPWEVVAKQEPENFCCYCETNSLLRNKWQSFCSLSSSERNQELVDKLLAEAAMK